MKKLIITAASTVILLLAACSNDGKDFKEDAERFIESTEIETQAGTTFTKASCTEPAKVEAGETFTCTAEGADGRIWDFDMVVESDNSYGMDDGQPRP